ncbi:MAG: alpha/beta hydrolase [Rhodospirillaceae bacterium]|nr:alpha/beta hydrolase [Rhodospirillaceae bacterium]
MNTSLTDPRDDVDPDIRRFIQITSADYAAFSATSGTGNAALREVALRVRERWRAGGPKMAASIDLTVGARNVRIRIHRPSDRENLPTLVYLHGGGWTLFSIDTHDRLMREYAARAGCAVLGIDYSLSPEVRFPHALDEIADVLAWLSSAEQTAGLSRDIFALGGDSAGANLAISTALRRVGRAAQPRALLLNYGAFDTEHRPSHRRYDGDRYMLTAAEMDGFWANYVGNSGRTEDVLARPLLASLKGLPPVFLCIPECDILVDENLEMARRLTEAGVEVDSHMYKGATHSFLEAVSISPLADLALEEASRWLQQRIGA